MVAFKYIYLKIRKKDIGKFNTFTISFSYAAPLLLKPQTIITVNNYTKFTEVIKQLLFFNLNVIKVILIKNRFSLNYITSNNFNQHLFFSHKYNHS